MGVRIIWRCDHAGCGAVQDVIPALSQDGRINGSDQWTPQGWGGLGMTLCPDHERERVAQTIAHMRPGEVWTA